MQPKPTIDLDGFGGLGVILKLPTGVFYHKQVAGFGCLHRESEGLFFPLVVQKGRTEEHALGQNFRGWYEHITNEQAAIIDHVLRGNGHGYLTVDRARLEESFEAWVHVVLGERRRSDHRSPLSGFGPCGGILVWPNSD